MRLTRKTSSRVDQTQSEMGDPADDITSLFYRAISSAGSAAYPREAAGSHREAMANSLSDLIDDISADCPLEDTLEQEPIRTLHHLSCTGGTLFSKCIASMGNTLVLNEIDYHSSLSATARGEIQFAPSDLVSLLRQGDPNVEHALIDRVLLRDISVIREEQWEIGRNLVLRDHTHSHFLVKATELTRPTLLEVLRAEFPIIPLVTVRDPVDSYLSMSALGWEKTFEPSTFDEYCRRYLLFLERYEDVPIVKYEDMTTHPHNTMKKICEILDLSYFSAFEKTFSTFKFSGDSGRTGTSIVPKSRKPLSKPLAKEVESSSTYRELRLFLNYDDYRER